MTVDPGQIRQGAGVFGILMAVVGVGMGSSIVVWVAVGLLALSLVLRVWSAVKARRGNPQSGTTE